MNSVRSAALRVFGEGADQCFLAVERSADFEEVMELVIGRNVPIPKVSADAGQDAAEGQVFDGHFDSFLRR